MPSSTAIKSYLDKAKKASMNSTYPKQKLGAVLVYGGKIIATGDNTCKTSPFQKMYNRYRFAGDSRNNGWIHAETMLLLKTRFLDIDWNKAYVYIYREYKNGESALARPCMACRVALEERGITNIFYTTEKGYEKL